MKDKKEGSNKSNIDYIEKITTPIFKKVLKEDLPNSMTTNKNHQIIFFRPNNYRLQIQVKEKTNSIINHLLKVNPTIRKNINPHTKIISIRNYKPNITIQYGKHNLTAIYSSPVIDGEKQGWAIERTTTDDISNRIDEIKQDIKKRLNDTLNEFSRKYGLVLPFKWPSWARHEDFIKGEEYIDKLPRQCIIHDTYFKKVYGKGIEFIGGKDKEPTVHLKNYIKNRAVEDIAPDIAEAINKFGAMLTGNINLVSQMANINLEVTKLRRDITKIQRKKKGRPNNKDLRRWV